MIVGTFSNPVPSEAVESDPSHDLETAEVLLEIIEKKIHKLYKVSQPSLYCVAAGIIT